MVATPDKRTDEVSASDAAWKALGPNASGARPEPNGEPVSGASRRLRALAALSGSLTDALSPAEAADLVEQKALSALGASSAVVVTLGKFPPQPAADGGAPPMLHVVHAIGLPAEVRAALDEVPLDAPVPFAQVAREGSPLFLPTVAALRAYPVWGDGMINAGAESAAIVPVWANGELRGVLGLSWAEPRTFDEDERAFVLTLGVMCAQAIMRAHLRAAEREARESAERANESKAHFVATISHELRTPMQAVMGYTQLLADEIDGPVTALQRDHLARVRASSQHLLDLISDLLGHARLEAGEEVVRAEAVELMEVVEQSLVLVRPMAEQKGLLLRVEQHQAPLELLTDVRKLRQILANVLANAVKFTQTGEVALVTRVDSSPGNAHVAFEVTDAGGGVAAEDREHIFEAFWQAHPHTVTSGGSTGLGLFVARNLARLLGGDVELARSERGKGSTFVISLPARYAEPALLPAV